MLWIFCNFEYPLPKSCARPWCKHPWPRCLQEGGQAPAAGRERKLQVHKGGGDWSSGDWSSGRSCCSSSAIGLAVGNHGDEAGGGGEPARWGLEVRWRLPDASAEALEG
jgi:hypothetical protein